MPPKFFKKKFSGKTSANIKVRNEYATYLIIVESPSKCEKIESYLGDNYCCIASKGHIRDIDGLKSIDTKNTFQPTFSIISEKKGHIEEMKKIIKNFKKENIILASDGDREGEAIAWHICEVFDLPVETTKRIIFHEVTKPALEEAVKNPQKVNMDLVHAQHARQVLDIIVGFKVSPYLWKYLYSSKTNALSAGRCQTPALRLVYDNEKEKNAGIETKYKTVGFFFEKNISFELNKEFDSNREVLDFLNKSKDFKYTLKMHPAKESKKSPPKPFSTSRLLQVASNVLHTSPKETMSICQKLYQSGHITYMRTESSQYSPVFLKKAEEYITKKYGGAIGDLDKLENKDANNPHEAIRVTNIEAPTITGDEYKEISMYKLIWRNTVESCMTDATYTNIKATISAPMDLVYEHTIEIPLKLGWRKVAVTEKDFLETQCGLTAFEMYLKNIESSKKPFLYNSIESTVVVRNKHQHYTEANLIHKLEDLGIGRPSTFATLVETIIDRGYVKKTDIEGSPIQCKEYKLVGKKLDEISRERIFGAEKSKLVIQPTGILTIEFLLKTFEQLFSYEYTKNMEENLDKVSAGSEKNWAKICSECLNEIKVLSKNVKNIDKQVYQVDEEHELVFSFNGPVLRKKAGNLLFPCDPSLNLDSFEEGDGGNHGFSQKEQKYEYIPVKKDIIVNLEKLKQGGYKYDDLVEIKNPLLGTYEGEPLYIKSGRFGAYVEWGNKKESIKALKIPFSNITLEDITKFLSEKGEKNENNILKVLNESMSIRKGKYGFYVFYKREDMPKPQFLNVKAYKGELFGEDTEGLVKWLYEKYNLQNT